MELGKMRNLARCATRPPVSVEEADTHVWWIDFLNARMVGIQACLALGESHEKIRLIFNLTDNILIETALAYQSEYNPQTEQ